MLIKLCVLAGAVVAGGIILGDWLNPAAGDGSSQSLESAKGFFDTAVYEPLAKAAGQATDAVSAEVNKAQKALSELDPLGSLKNVFSSVFG